MTETVRSAAYEGQQACERFWRGGAQAGLVCTHPREFSANNFCIWILPPPSRNPSPCLSFCHQIIKPVRLSSTMPRLSCIAAHNNFRCRRLFWGAQEQFQVAKIQIRCLTTRSSPAACHQILHLGHHHNLLKCRNLH